MGNCDVILRDAISKMTYFDHFNFIQNCSYLQRDPTEERALLPTYEGKIIIYFYLLISYELFVS